MAPFTRLPLLSHPYTALNSLGALVHPARGSERKILKNVMMCDDFELASVLQCAGCLKQVLKSDLWLNRVWGKTKG